MRKYALVVLDKQDKIIDSYPLDYVTNSRGNGFELGLNYIETSLENVVTGITHRKNKVTFVINQIGESYQLATLLSRWLQKYSRKEYQMALEYKDGTGIIRYVTGYVTRLTKDEKTYRNVLLQTGEFTTTGHFFQKKEVPIIIKPSTFGKKYPYSYPYAYGDMIYTDNNINNDYLEEIPINVIINGKILNPVIELLDENGESYNKVKINVDIQEDETLVINSIKRKVYKIVNGKEVDMINEVDTNFDTFLYAKIGDSTLNANISDAGSGYKLTGIWRQYEL